MSRRGKRWLVAGWGVLVVCAGGVTLWLNGGADAPSQQPEPEFGWFSMSPEPPPERESEPKPDFGLFPVSPEPSPVDVLPTGVGSLR
ncbi:hypothetical protein C3486_14705 [Streptomyces sp. Ru73]|uniref:hypothetical protein n=1 Tax=Streptomyces sp. Ru73 TaxID=2080748 RepID=UPI000CDCEBE8|nr:hypothetical protein [Streptomyces sp. Ru73]POX40196.1 hypothetical protein C3486_14705 [Streptomyces sp. Ru73]